MTIKQYNIMGIALCTLALLLLICWRLSISGQNKALKKTVIVDDGIQTAVLGPRKMQEDYSLIASNNLFHPLRGKAPAADAVKTQQDKKSLAVLNFELKGIYHSDSLRAALIQFRGNAPGPKSGELQKADASLFYIGNGYILQEVKTRSVVITRGSEKIEVELQMLLPPEARGETQPSATVPPPVVKPELPKKE